MTQTTDAWLKEEAEKLADVSRQQGYLDREEILWALHRTFNRGKAEGYAEGAGVP